MFFRKKDKKFEETIIEFDSKCKFIKTLKRGDVFPYDCTCKIWNNDKVNLYIDDILGELINNYLLKIDEKLSWLEEHKHTVAEALIADGIISLAEDWASASEEAEDEEQECYIMEDGLKVFIPITKEAFTNSLNMDGITVYIDKEKDEISLELFLVCSPDYFAYHAINVVINADNSIENNSLCG